MLTDEKNMRDMIRQLSTAEILAASYKEIFPEITDAEAAELAELFLKGSGGDMKPLRDKLAVIKEKYREREWWEELDFSFPEMEEYEFPEIEWPTLDLDDL